MANSYVLHLGFRNTYRPGYIRQLVNNNPCVALLRTIIKPLLIYPYAVSNIGFIIQGLKVLAKHCSVAVYRGQSFS